MIVAACQADEFHVTALAKSRVGTSATTSEEEAAARKEQERIAAEAAQILEKQSLGGRLVVLGPDGKLLGAVTFHDLLAAGVV